MQRYAKSQWFAGFFAAAILIAALSGCGSQATPPAATTAPTVAPTQAPATPTLAPATPTLVPATPTQEAPTLEPSPTPESATATPMAPTLPTPPDAADLAYDPDTQEITYSSPSAIKALVEFYRAELPAAGWQEDAAVAMVTDEVGAINFAKGQATLNIMMVKADSGTRVDISTSGLGNEQVAGGTPEATNPAPPAALKAEDKDGLPVPEDYTQYVGDSGAYRRSLTTVSPSALSAVLALYRSELTARGWRELPGGAAPTDSKADLSFDHPAQGQLALSLTRNADNGTDISLVVHDQAAAKKAGILPPTGQARIYFGNVTDGEVIFKIDGKEIKVGVQDPSQRSMEGVPFVDLAPGKHDFTLTLKGQTPLKDAIPVAAGETWALAAGPGGALPLQMY